MFGSDILDVAIGLALIFLMLSLIASGVREAVEAIVKSRAVELERGIRALLDDPAGTGMAKLLYQHPLEPSRGILPKLFTYARYNAELTSTVRTTLGLPNIDPKHVQKLGSIEHIPELQRVGRAVAALAKTEHFDGF